MRVYRNIFYGAFSIIFELMKISQVFKICDDIGPVSDCLLNQFPAKR